MKQFQAYFSLSVILIFMHLPLRAIYALDEIIPPQHLESSLYKSIYLLAKNETLSSILEIGSSSGGGTTEALVLGVIQNHSRPQLFCLEISRPRFEILSNRYRHLPSVKCYLASSVPPEDFLSENEIIHILTLNPQLIGRNTTVEEILATWHVDINYASTITAPKNGIALIKKENNIDNFDMVVIDGSCFTTAAELKLIYGAYLIVLDGILSIKNHANYQTLRNDPAYELIDANNGFRNNYAVFKRKKMD